MNCLRRYLIRVQNYGTRPLMNYQVQHIPHETQQSAQQEHIEQFKVFARKHSLRESAVQRENILKLSKPVLLVSVKTSESQFMHIPNIIFTSYKHRPILKLSSPLRLAFDHKMDNRT